MIPLVKPIEIGKYGIRERFGKSNEQLPAMLRQSEGKGAKLGLIIDPEHEAMLREVPNAPLTFLLKNRGVLRIGPGKDAAGGH